MSSMTSLQVTPETSKVSIFHFGDQEIRVVYRNGAPWFIAVDVCRALGFDTSKGTVKYTSSLLPDERCIIFSGPPGSSGGYEGLRPNTEFGIISESGLYNLIMRAQHVNPEAKAFQEWVTREVLPAIRKTGSYSRDPQLTIPTDPAEVVTLMARAVLCAYAALEKANQHIATRDQQITARGQPTTEPDEAGGDCVCITSIARTLGIRQQWFFRKLRELGIIERKNRDNKPTLDYLQNGYFIVRHEVSKGGYDYRRTLVTPKGARWLSTMASEEGWKERSQSE